jgi:tricorn protease
LITEEDGLPDGARGGLDRIAGAFFGSGRRPITRAPAWVTIGVMRRAFGPILLFCLALLPAASLAQSGPPEARLLRYPSIHGDFVAFVYAGDIWRAPVAGGPALRLTSHPGLELFPKISPDGKWIAFSAEYSGSRQIWVMPSWGGPPNQLTFYNDVGPMPPRGGWDYWVLGWTPDGKVLFRGNRTPHGERNGRYYTIDPKGGLETPLPLPEGGSASLSPDGGKLAYCPVDREFRTWKRTMGGRAQDVWIYDFASKKSERITDWKGTDNFPMWAGSTVYFTSDRERTLNLFAYDTKTKKTRQVTHFSEFDVLWPSLGNDAIVFMNGGSLYRLDLATEQSSKIPITLGTDLAAAVPHFQDVKDRVARASLSPSGARALFEARGDLYTVPAKDGPTRNLTRTPGIREHSATWSPDGKSVAYLSDETGEYEVYVRPQDGSGAPRRLTTGGDVWKFAPVFSPDGKNLAFADKKLRLLVLDVASGAVTEADRSDKADLTGYSFSPDGRWIAYEKVQANRIPGIAVYSLDQKKSFLLGDGLSPNSDPAFSKDGKHLFFLSARDYNLTFSAFEFNYLYTRATRVYAASLDPAAPALFPPKSDEETGEKSEAKKDDKKDEAKGAAKGTDKPADKKPEPTVVDAAGFTARTIALPGVKAGDLEGLAVGADALFYIRAEGDRALYRYDLKERKEEKVLDAVDGYDLSLDGKKLLMRTGQDWTIADAKAGLKAGDGRLDLSGLKARIEPRAEWAQMFEDGWRITRDWFYDSKMHGIDWAAMKQRYGALVPYVSHRSDLDFLFGEMLGELEAGHTYVQAGDEPRVPRIQGGLLGCTLAADPSGRYRISKIYAGENWDEAWRSPLTEPGVDVKEGEFLLSVDGVDLKSDDNPYRLLENRAGKQVALLVGSDPSGKGARTVTVRPIASELNLLTLDWVKSRMAYADKLSGGRVGYVYLPDTAQDGNRMLQKLFYSQASKPALIVDDRWNGGGFIPDRMIEYFSRTTMARWARRGAESMRTPAFAHDGPKAMLTNGYSSSGGDALPYFFRKNGLGKLIGTRTWGGLIGLSGNPALVDGGAILVPTFRIYDENGKWVVENEGVSPDLEVVDLPEEVMAGRDPSLEKGVEVLLKELTDRGNREPAVPVPPDMVKKKGN